MATAATEFSFDTHEIQLLRQALLVWYDANKRSLPWRSCSGTCNDYAYSVWVSEMMLQQTRVSCAKNYYCRWMQKWPNLSSLAQSTEEEVNKMWSGLGYYSRGRRLREGAIKVMQKMNGLIPNNRFQLEKQLPGVGWYTASAISSIAFGEVVGAVDGNVIRVLCRLRCIGGNVKNAKVSSFLWKLADDLVDPERPGDFNQAMMELGATVCLPSKPHCSACPIKSVCEAYRQVHEHSILVSLSKNTKEMAVMKEELIRPCESTAKLFNCDKQSSKNDNKEEVVRNEDIEDCCAFLALPKTDPWRAELGVMNYPRKPSKKPPRLERRLVAAIEVFYESGEKALAPRTCRQWLLVQRPASGLLAGLWEFPNALLLDSSAAVNSGTLTDHCSQQLKSISDKTLLGSLSTPYRVVARRYVGELTHLFSHIRQINYVEHWKVRVDAYVEVMGECSRLISGDELKNSAVSASVGKMYALCSKASSHDRKFASKSKRKLDQVDGQSFFSKQQKK